MESSLFSFIKYVSASQILYLNKFAILLIVSHNLVLQMRKLLTLNVLLCIVLGDYILCINTRNGCHICCKGFHVPYARNAVGSFVYYMSQSDIHLQHTKFCN